MEHIISFKTNFGWINAKELDDYVVSVSFGKLNKNNPSKTLYKLKKNIQNYFLGQELVWKFKLGIIGSPLQKKIWEELQKIPYGETRSYGFIAKKLKTSPRYVGNVCGQNKHLLIIPCHRVVRSDGSLGGFSGLGGIKLKNKLIKMEKNV